MIYKRLAAEHENDLVVSMMMKMSPGTQKKQQLMTCFLWFIPCHHQHLLPLDVDIQICYHILF